MKECRKIGLFITIDDAYTRGIVRGIIKFARQETNWTLLGHDWMFSPLDGKNTQLDGIISRIENKTDGYTLTKFGVPVIDVAGAYTGCGYFEVNNDDYATGVKAAYHLSQLGHTSFAWAGAEGVQWSRCRFNGFITTILHAGTFEKPLEWWEQLNLETGELKNWLCSLSKPVALFAANDTIGLKIITVCKNSREDEKLSVPADIAVLGVDNEDILCELATPPLSSIALNCVDMGFSAAALLEKMLMPEHTVSAHSIIIPPLDIIERESTRILVTPDKLVNTALNFIMNSAHTGITVEDVLEKVPASRRNLEQRFRKITGKTLHEAIIDARIQYSKKLMRYSDAALTVIAEQSGFGSLQRFHKEFKQKEGCTPASWKRDNQQPRCTSRGNSR
jgi:LacI family transcriptional regulator